MRFGTAKTQLRAAGGYFSLPPWLNNPFSKWWSGICAFRNAQNSDCYLVYLKSAWADHEMYVCMYVCIDMYLSRTTEIYSALTPFEHKMARWPGHALDQLPLLKVPREVICFSHANTWQAKVVTLYLKI